MSPRACGNIVHPHASVETRCRPSMRVEASAEVGAKLLQTSGNVLPTWRAFLQGGVDGFSTVTGRPGYHSCKHFSQANVAEFCKGIEYEHLDHRRTRDESPSQSPRSESNGKAIEH